MATPHRTRSTGAVTVDTSNDGTSASGRPQRRTSGAAAAADAATPASTPATANARRGLGGVDSSSSTSARRAREPPEASAEAPATVSATKARRIASGGTLVVTPSKAVSPAPATSKKAAAATADETPSPGVGTKRGAAALVEVESDSASESVERPRPAASAKRARKEPGPRVGELVDAKWPEDGRYYSAVVVALPGEGKDLYTVRYDDGLTLDLPADALRRLVYNDNAILPAATELGASWTPEDITRHATELLDTIVALKQGRCEGPHQQCKSRVRSEDAHVVTGRWLWASWAHVQARGLRTVYGRAVQNRLSGLLAHHQAPDCAERHSRASHRPDCVLYRGNVALTATPLL